MLSRLEIENYGLIAAAAVEFAPGATIFTGETGSGKTMLLGALDFALGARAGADVVGRAARRAAVSITFEPDETLRARLEADGFALDPGEEASIAREVTDGGRSSVRVNGRSSTAGYVREIGVAIAEIVGQHEAQRLLAAAYHLELLDRFAGEPALRLREAAGAAYASAQAAAAEYERLTSEERDARGRYDEALFVAREIEEARLDAGEIARLRERRAFLDNVERIATALAGAREGLANDDGGAAPALGVAAAALAGVGAFGEELREMAQRAAVLQSDAGELAGDVARALEAAEYDPAELESINARLAAVERLQRRYGDEIEDILERAARARRTIDEFENRDALLERVRLQADAANAELQRAAALLSKARRKAAATLAKRVLAELGEIALGSGRFDVAVRPAGGRRRARRRSRGVSLCRQCGRKRAADRARRFGRRVVARAARTGRRAGAGARRARSADLRRDRRRHRRRDGDRRRRASREARRQRASDLRDAPRADRHGCAAALRSREKRTPGRDDDKRARAKRPQGA